MQLAQNQTNKETGRPGRGGLRAVFGNATLQAGLILLLELLTFFSMPLLKLPDHYYSSADLTQLQSLTNLTPGYLPANELLSDPVVAFQPWLMFNREMLWAGQIPLWNPYNGNGAPHLANFQSAVFSPYSLPFYLLTIRQALIVSAFLKLFGLGFFTYLFLKTLRLRQGAALVGASAFMFAGYNIAWLSWPHVAAAIVLPASLYFAEVIFQRYEAVNPGSKPAYFWPLVGFSLSLTVGLLAGHPETFYFCGLLVGAYWLFRLVNLGFSQKNFKRLVGLIWRFGLAGLIGVGLTALQLLPFFEYLGNSAALDRRDTANFQGLNLDQWPLMLLPNLLGSSALPYRVIGTTLNNANSNEVYSNYAGGLVLFLALLSLSGIQRDKFSAFFGAAVLLWLAVAYNLPGIGPLVLNVLPGLKTASPARSQEIWAFSLSCGAALFLNRALSWQPVGKARFSRIRAIGTALAGLIFLIIGLVGARRLVEDSYQNILPQLNEFLAYVPGHVWWMGLSFGVGLLALVALWLIYSEWLKNALAGVILLAVFWQSGYLLKDYNPTIPDRYFYPVTPAIQTLQQTVGQNNLVIYGTDTILPDTNLAYRLAVPSNFDAMDVRYHSHFLEEFFGSTLPVYPIVRINETGLKMLGTTYLVAPGSWLQPDPLLSKVTTDPQKLVPAGEILPEKALVQTFQASYNQLQAVSLHLTTFGHSNNCQLSMRLEEVSTGKVLREDGLNCSKIADGEEIRYRFAPIADTKNKLYRLVLSTTDAKPGSAISALTNPTLVYPASRLQQGSQILAGGLNFNLYYRESDTFQFIQELGAYNFYRFQGAPAYFSVSRAVAARSDEEALQLIKRSEFDPTQEVILSQVSTVNSSGQKAEPPVTAQLLTQQPDRLTLKTERTTPGYLVLSRAWYPGWKARVNGIEKPVLRANYAFSAVELGAGPSQVEFYYDPASFKIGLLISFASLIAGLLLTGWQISQTKLIPRSSGTIRRKV